MNTIELNPSINLANEATATKRYAVYEKFIDFANGQTKKRLFWFLLSIIGPGVLFLPIPAALMYYYDAPIWTLVTTLVLFFASVIAGMGGSKVSVLIALLYLNIAVHVALILMFVI